jgi:prophage regulatory protein
VLIGTREIFPHGHEVPMKTLDDHLPERRQQLRMLDFVELKPLKGVGYSRDHLRRLVRNGTFPPPIQLSDSRIAWLESEIDAWIMAKAAGVRSLGREPGQRRVYDRQWTRAVSRMVAQLGAGSTKIHARARYHRMRPTSAQGGSSALPLGATGGEWHTGFGKQSSITLSPLLPGRLSSLP